LLLRHRGASEKQHQDENAGALPQVESAHYKLSSVELVGFFNILDARPRVKPLREARYDAASSTPARPRRFE
jgi:hypothetical protein